MAIRIVQSKQNARVKELRAALLHPTRSPSSLVALEGLHLLTEALRSSADIKTIFIAQGSENLLDTLLKNSPISPSVEILALPYEVLASAVTTEAPQPVAALIATKSWLWADLLPSSLAGNHAALIVVLAGIQDPGNLGTILRSAEAFGAIGAICLPGTVSRWNPKSMRASAGTVFRLPTITASEEDCFEHLHSANIQTLAAMAHNATPISNHDLKSPIAFVIGAEGSGLSDQLAAECHARITIPCPGPVESLNAAVAAGVLLYEASRQRATPSIKHLSKPAHISKPAGAPTRKPKA